MLDLDYLFRGELSTVGGTEGPASHTLRMQFFDHHRGETVKEGSAAWTGIVSDGLDEVRELARTFLPLDELMVDYERIPETASVEPEKDPIANADRMTVQVRDIMDSRDRPSQPWQWILVQVEKGRILNGEAQGEGFRRFEVGGGSVDLSYKAPDACKKQTETIAIYNSCNNDMRTVVNLIPEKEIAVGSFEIRCVPKNTWTGTITYTRSYNKTNFEQGPDNSTVKMQKIVMEKADFDVHGWPFSHEYEGSVGTDLYYEGEEDSVTGTYSGTYKKITTIRTAEGTSTITDSALCQAVIRDSGYLVVNDEEMRAYLEVGTSFVGYEPCRGQSVYSGPRDSFTMEFHWDQLETFAGLGYLEFYIPAKNPRTVTGSYSLPNLGITWTWNLSLSGRQ
jgi:hypothetical protein